MSSRILDAIVPSRRRLRAVLTYLDEWEQSFGMGDRPLPAHWGVTQRFADLRTLAGFVQ